MIKNTVMTCALAGVLVVLASGCSDTSLGSKSFSEETQFDIDYVPLLSGSGLTATIDEIPILVRLADLPGYEPDDLNYVTSVKIRNIVFEIGDGSNDPAIDPNEDGNLDSFEFVSELKIGLASVGGGDRVEVASLPMNDPQIASNVQSVRLNVADVDIRDIIENPAGAQLLIGITGSLPPDLVRVDVKVDYRVGIGIR